MGDLFLNTVGAKKFEVVSAPFQEHGEGPFELASPAVKKRLSTIGRFETCRLRERCARQTLGQWQDATDRQDVERARHHVVIQP